MSPPEIWGPAVWTLFHTLVEKVNENYYVNISSKLYFFIVRICKFLPCPDCSNDSSKFLAKIKFSDLKTKYDLKNTLYIFHNWVNSKKRKPLFNYSNMEVYGRYNLISVINNFIAKYQTKGNMKLLTESFQRDIIIRDFKSWITRSIRIFMPVINIPRVIINQPKKEEMESIVEEVESVEEELKDEEEVVKTDEEVEEVNADEEVKDDEEVKTYEEVKDDEEEVKADEDKNHVKPKTKRKNKKSKK